jgi:hypothetical protein
MPAKLRYTDFQIGNEGRRWTAAEYMERLEGAPEKMELFDGWLYGDEEERLYMLALFLEHVGADKAVQLGDPEVWRRAVAKLG